MTLVERLQAAGFWVLLADMPVAAVALLTDGWTETIGRPAAFTLLTVAVCLVLGAAVLSCLHASGLRKKG